MTPDALIQKFDAARPLLQSALDRANGEYLLDDILEGVLDERLQLWTAPGFAGVTEVLNYPRRRVVLVHLCAGELDAIRAAEGQLTRFAQIVGADAIRILGRRGWAKALADYGYRESAVEVTKEVPRGR